MYMEHFLVVKHQHMTMGGWNMWSFSGNSWEIPSGYVETNGFAHGNLLIKNPICLEISGTCA
jgi:hypothetical protein